MTSGSRIPQMSESQLYDLVVGSEEKPGLALVYHWRVAHFRPALTAKGWRTPVSAHGKGFPDLLMVRDMSLIAVELKSNRGKLSPEQLAWIDALENALTPVYVWRPADWHSGSILRTLSGQP